MEQKLLKESETGKLINTDKLGATMEIRKLIGNGVCRMKFRDILSLEKKVKLRIVIEPHGLSHVD